MNATEVKFIMQEAQEKAAEIGVSAEEEFNITKLQLIEAEKAKIRREYERKEGNIDVKKKVEFSKQLNESRLRVLQAREDAVHAVLREGYDALAALSKDRNKYTQLLADLLVQSLGKLKEPRALVRCREVDVDAVKAAIPKAKTRFSQEFGSPAPEVDVDTAHYLPPPPKGSKQEDEFASCCGRVVVTSGDGKIVPITLQPLSRQSHVFPFPPSLPPGAAAAACCGGVLVTSGDGKIVCSNTLDDRLRITYSQNLPTVRSTLFGTAAA
ncbi:hypothetical protein N2152v2_002953 [Parachlorella kessleri]